MFAHTKTVSLQYKKTHINNIIINLKKTFSYHVPRPLQQRQTAPIDKITRALNNLSREKLPKKTAKIDKKVQKQGKNNKKTDWNSWQRRMQRLWRLQSWATRTRRM